MFLDVPLAGKWELSVVSRPTKAIMCINPQSDIPGQFTGWYNTGVDGDIKDQYDLVGRYDVGGSPHEGYILGW